MLFANLSGPPKIYLPQLSELSIRLQLAANPRPGIFGDTRRYDYKPISLQEYRDFALGPFAQFRNLSQVSITGVSKSIANELKKAMLGREPIINLSQMYDGLMRYLRKCLQYDHCAYCRSAFRHAARADFEVDMEDERAFRKFRSKIFAIVSEHEKRDLRIALRDDPDVEVGEFDSTWIEDGDRYEPPQEHSDWKLANPIEESDEDLEFKRQQEKERPSLVRLREVVCKERDFA